MRQEDIKSVQRNYAILQKLNVKFDVVAIVSRLINSTIMEANWR
jgi:hypothetical protein